MAGKEYSEIDEKLRAHQKWLQVQDKKKGSRFDLLDQQYPEIDLSEKTWGKEVNLEKALFKNTNLTKANFAGANLKGADFTGANLQEANLQHTDLQYADFSETKGLLLPNLAGADLTGAKLPEDLQDVKPLAIVDEGIRTGRHYLLTIILISLFAFLNVFTASDPQLLTNAPIPLIPFFRTDLAFPFIRMELPVTLFFIISPFLLLSFFIYFHIHLQRFLWEIQAQLPAVFPDGQSLDKKVYPWLLCGWVRLIFPRIENNNRILIWIQMFMIWLTVYFLPLFILLNILTRCLACHNAGLTIYHAVLMAIAITSGISFFWSGLQTLRGKTRKMPLLYNSVILMLSFGIFYFLSSGAINARPHGEAPHYIEWVSFKYFSPFANFEEREVSYRSENMKGRTSDCLVDDELKAVQGARLRERKLQYLKGRRAFLVKAEMNGANLTGADLREADLQKACLAGATLNEAKLQKAILTGAIFFDQDEKPGSNDANSNNPNHPIEKTAKLKKADLREAKLHSAILKYADLEGAWLNKAQLYDPNSKQADLGKANLRGANLRKADLRDACVHWKQLQDAACLQGIKINHEILREANFENINLTGAVLKGADLSGANLMNAILEEVDFEGASIEKADLQGAKLTGAKNLSPSQLAQAENLSEIEFNKAHLIGAKFENKVLTGARFEGARLDNAFLKGATLNKVKLKGAVFKGCDLREAHLNDAEMQEVDFERALTKDTDFSNADLTGAKNLTREQLQRAKELKGIKWPQAQLEGAQFPKKNLEGAFLPGANLSNANLTRAKLRGANLRGANLQNANLKGVNLNEIDLQGTDLRSVNLTPLQRIIAQGKGANL